MTSVTSCGRSESSPLRQMVRLPSTAGLNSFERHRAHRKVLGASSAQRWPSGDRICASASQVWSLTTVGLPWMAEAREGSWRRRTAAHTTPVSSCRAAELWSYHTPTACVPPRQSRGVDSSSWRLQLRWCLNYLAALTRVAPAAHGFRSAPRAAPCGPAPPTCGHPRRARSCPPHEKSRSPAPEHRRHHDGERGAHFMR